MSGTGSSYYVSYVSMCASVGTYYPTYCQPDIVTLIFFRKEGEKRMAVVNIGDCCGTLPPCFLPWAGTASILPPGRQGEGENRLVFASSPGRQEARLFS